MSPSTNLDCSIIKISIKHFNRTCYFLQGMSTVDLSTGEGSSCEVAYQVATYPQGIQSCHVYALSLPFDTKKKLLP